MKYFKKRCIVLSAPVLMLLGFAAATQGAPIAGVKFTPHNLSTSGPGSNFKSDNESEICIFCHTPHNSAAGKPFLWNRQTDANSALTFSLYTSSPTLDFKGQTYGTLSDVSKMCMTCHDGGTSFNSMANPRSPVPTWTGGADQLSDVWDGVMGWGPNIGEGPGAGGGELTNDHPVSFVYEESENNDVTIKPRDGGGKSVNGLPLWERNGDNAFRVECVTCHDPHINYNPLSGGNVAYKPFLRRSNSSSGLCFSCHNK